MVIRQTINSDISAIISRAIITHKVAPCDAGAAGRLLRSTLDSALRRSRPGIAAHSWEYDYDDVNAPAFNADIRSESTRLNSSHPRLSRMPSSA